MDVQQNIFTRTSTPNSESQLPPTPETGTQSIEYYENQVPDFADGELDRIYGSLFSSMLHFKNTGAITAEICTYVAKSGESIDTILLFRRRGSHVHVLNQRIILNEEALIQFANYVFNTYKSVHVINFQAIHTCLDQADFPSTSAGCPAELVINLPGSAEDYRASLGRHTRYNVKHYMEKLLEELPSFHLDFYIGSAADEKDIREIFRFNKARILAKNDVYYRSEEEIQRILALVRKYGVVVVATVDGVVCGGKINYRIGNNSISAIVSHDPKYNEQRIGTLCTYQAICKAIADGAKQYNFMTGNNDHKQLFRAQMRHYRHVAVYRSGLHRLLHAGTGLTMLWQDANYRFTFACQERLYALQRIRKNAPLDFSSRMLFHALVALRAFKQLFSRILVSLK